MVRERLGDIAAGFLTRNGLSLEDIGAFVCHPGGAKVVAALEEAFGLPAGLLVEARRVLRDYGNMSSVTAMFVLERALRAGDKGAHLLAAFGPGFSAYFAALDL